MNQFQTKTTESMSPLATKLLQKKPFRSISYFVMLSNAQRPDSPTTKAAQPARVVSDDCMKNLIEGPHSFKPNPLGPKNSGRSKSLGAYIIHSSILAACPKKLLATRMFHAQIPTNQKPGSAARFL